MAKQRPVISAASMILVSEIKDLLESELTDNKIIEMCIQSVYDNLITNDLASQGVNVTQDKLDQIISMLEGVLPEI